MTKINWKYFWDNSSTTDAVYDFADGMSFKEAFRAIKWPPQVKKELSKLKKLPSKTARARAKQAIVREERNHTVAFAIWT